MIYFDKKSIKLHPSYRLFLDRRDLAMQKIANSDKRESTPLSVLNASEYMLEYKGKTVYVCTPSNLYEELLSAAYSIALRQERDGVEYCHLMNQVFNCKKFRLRIRGWGEVPWTRSFDGFLKYVEIESFFYFDDGEDQYYFKLFRPLSKNLFNTGILHTLTRHFGDFTKYKFDEAPNKSGEYNYSDVMFNLIDSSINGQVFEEEPKCDNNKKINKELALGDKFLRIGLYWDNEKEVYMLNTLFITDKSKIE